MALRTCLRRAAHQLSSRSLLASAATQSRGLACSAVAGGDDNGDEYFRPIWKSSEGQYAAQLASGRWVHIPIDKSDPGITRIGKEVIEDTKPAGFDERIEVTTDWEELVEEHEGTDLYYFIYHATSKELRGKWCMDAATSLEEAAQALEAYAAYVRGLSKDGWYAAGQAYDDRLHLRRDLK